MSKISASNIYLALVNETIKQLIAKNKVNDPENRNLDEVQTLLNDELNETLDESPIAPQFVDEKELEILIIAIIATLKKNLKDVDRRKPLILSKIH